MEKELYVLEISETLEHVMPALQDLELELLTQSLLKEGCRDPLVVWNGVIVDGHNRYRICHENAIPFSLKEMEFESEAAAKIWIVRNQLARRNVPDFVRCELVLPLESELKAEAKKRQGWRKNGIQLPQNSEEGEKAKETGKELAEMAGISHDTLYKVKHILAKADDETKDKLRRGELSIHKAYTEMKRSRENSSEAKKSCHEGLEYHTEAVCPPKKKPGDLVPGFGVEEILSQMDDSGYIRPPDSVYDLPPTEVFGNMPADNLQLRGNAEFVHARSDLQSSTDYYVRRVVEILHEMTSASTSEENIKILDEIVSTGYAQIINTMKSMITEGAESEEAEEEQ